MQVNTVSPSLVVALTSAPRGGSGEKRRWEKALSPCKVMLHVSGVGGGVGGASLTSFQQEPDVLGIVDLHAVTAGQSVEQSGLS